MPDKEAALEIPLAHLQIIEAVAGRIGKRWGIVHPKQISLAKASEILGLSRYELMERFERLEIPLRLGPETLADAQQEIASAQYSRTEAE